MTKRKTIVVAISLGIVTLGVVLWRAQTGDAQSVAPLAAADPASALVEITLPQSLSANAQIGAQVFASACAACHGNNAVGIDGAGPPLIHRIYEPSHHGDESFQIAAAQGVRAHHWPFGNMPPVEGLTRGDVSMVIAYIREVQRANGIH